MEMQVFHMINKAFLEIMIEGDAGFSYGYALTPFYVNAFFFISGYLLFKKYMKVPGTVCFPKNKYHKMIANVAFRLIIPLSSFQP